MSGDVQPRKRKDKKKKKDELGIEEPRGTAAALGEGDVFMHSQHEHGTGGHWCAKIIFFSLLAVLIGLIGLIILENRGLSELEANSVESRYSGVLDGWLEDVHDDDHHDEHTLELKHHDEDEHEDDEDDDSGIEVEKIEREVSDEDAVSNETQDAEDDNVSQEESKEEDNNDIEDDDADESEFLEPEELIELPVVERITAPKGKPLAEVEEDTSTEKPLDTLAEEEEYEQQQEALRREQEQASHIWLKLAVGGALLVATHAVVRRATAPRDSNGSEVDHSREETPSLIDRRMTLIPPERPPIPAPTLIEQEIPLPVVEKEVFRRTPIIIKSAPIQKEESDNEIEDVEEVTKDIKVVEPPKDTVDKELYSDEEEEVKDEEEEEEVVVQKKEVPKQSTPVINKESTPEPEPEEELPDDVEIIEEEQLDEELEEEEVEEEISDVDDTELLNRLEAKYGRLPEPERPGQKHKDGGNSVEEEWPGEPADAYWREQLDQAEQELQQDWLE